MSKLEGKKILIFIGDIYEELELWYPKIRLEEEGAKVVLAGPEANTVYSGKNGYNGKSDISYHDITAEDFDGLVVPGGYMPDKLRRDQKVLDITADFHKQNKMIAFICHGGWIPISAKVVNGYTLTSVNAIKDDLINAGADWVDEAVVVDRNIITSRTPTDLGHFAKAMIAFLSR
ncbi:MAG: type 1 glutamine amidotransferase [Balneolales bacterium]|nr:type 1 glutamine amidotransferase [Balneolales bacterium]